MNYYLFAKYFQDLSIEELMKLCQKLGLNGPTALVREGYWLEEDTLLKTLPAFVRVAERYGLEVKYANTPVAVTDPDDFSQINHFTEQMKVFADCGIENVRLAHIPKTVVRDMRELSGHVRRIVSALADATAHLHIRLVVQIHGFAYPHNATAAWEVIQGLDPASVGVKLDPGNNVCQEGYEQFDYQIQLLHEYIAALGAKDACPVKGEEVQNRWRAEFVPAYEGVVNYRTVFTQLHKIGFDGPVILMPFYHTASRNQMLDSLKKEIAYFKKCTGDCQSELSGVK